MSESGVRLTGRVQDVRWNEADGFSEHLPFVHTLVMFLTLRQPREVSCDQLACLDLGLLTELTSGNLKKRGVNLQVSVIRTEKT